MNIQRLREARHGYFKMAVALLPIALLFGCNSAPTGTAPGLAGGQALTPGITNYPMAYVKQPVLAKSTNKKNKAPRPTTSTCATSSPRSPAAICTYATRRAPQPPR